MVDVFLSYSSHNRNLIGKYAALLEEQGFEVWWDLRVDPGQIWDKEIEEALHKAKSVLVFWSEEAKASQWVRAEANLAKDQGKILFHTRLDRCSLPLPFNLEQYLDLNTKGDIPESKNWQELIKLMKLKIKNNLSRKYNTRTNPVANLEKYTGKIIKIPIKTEESSPPNIYMSATPVTFEKFDMYCSAKGISYPQDEGWGRGLMPVINISYQDAENFCEWVTEQTGMDTRLPTENEWEIAANAEKNLRFPWGELWEPQNANANNNIGKTRQVGSYLENSLGFYDIVGNVWEWCAGDIHQNLQNDRRAVTRGCAWNTPEAELDLRAKKMFRKGFRLHFIGFRVLAKIF